MDMKIRIAAEKEELSGLIQRVEEWCEERNMDMDDSYVVMLAIEELSSNTVTHADCTRPDACIEVSVEIRENTVYMRYTDNMPPFNPWESGNPDKNAGIDDTPVGGLGLFLLKNMLDSMDYAYRENVNIITMTKKLSV
jgi:anti-sigma regulatory factor (Ser/Thr protein kinase)